MIHRVIKGAIVQFPASPHIRAAMDHRPSPPVRRGKPAKQPAGGKAETGTFRQQLFEQAVRDFALYRNDPRVPSIFEVEGYGPAYPDQGCIAMASNWLDYRISNDGWPVGLTIKADAWTRGRPAPP